MHQVSIVKCADYVREHVETAVRQSFENLGGVHQFIQPGMRVVLKPNLLSPRSPDTATVTHPEVTCAIARIVLEQGAHPVIADSPGGYFNLRILKKLYQACGLTGLCMESGIPLNFDIAVKTISYDSGRGKRSIPVLKPLTEADLIINICKMKTHGMMVFTGGVKNMFGAIPGTYKAMYHLHYRDYDTFANELIDICQFISPRLNFMDAITAMEGKGPSAGTPRNMGLLLASESPFSLDSAAHDIVGIDKNASYVMKNAAIRGIETRYQEVGEKVVDVSVSDFQVPYVRKGLPLVRSKIMEMLLTQSKSRLTVNSDRCTSCKVCSTHCPADSIRMRKGIPVFDRKQCIRCFCCHELCPEQAIDIREAFLVRFLAEKKKASKT